MAWKEREDTKPKQTGGHTHACQNHVSDQAFKSLLLQVWLWLYGMNPHPSSSHPQG